MESKKKLNILILSWRGPGHPNAGGGEIATHEHAKGWVKAGHRVTLFTSLYQDAQDKEIIDGVNIIRRGAQLFEVHIQAFIWYLFKKHQKFDIVVDQFHGIPFFTPLYISGKKLAFIHEVAKEVWFLNEFSFPLNFIIPILGRPLEPIIFKIYKGIQFMTVSESTKSDLISWGIKGSNIAVINNGIENPNMEFPKKEKVKTVIFLGALAKDKGIEKALDVFSLLKKKYQNSISFWVVGKGHPKYEAFLKEKSKILGLRNIKFWGFVEDKQKFTLLGRAQILINTSVREGWGLVVLEAASVGTPTVAFNVQGLKDSIRDNETGLLSESIEVFVENVTYLLEDQKKYKEIRKNAINWSQNFSWEKSAKMSLDLINRIAG